MVKRITIRKKAAKKKAAKKKARNVVTIANPETLCCSSGIYKPGR
jgi:hypothetical protein